MAHGLGGFANLAFADSRQWSGDDGKSSDQRTAGTDRGGDFFQNLLGFEKVLEHMQEDRGVEFALESERGIFEIRLLKIGVAGLRQALTPHHGIDGGPTTDLNAGRGGLHKLEHLADMHADLGDIDRAGDALAFLAEELVAKPVAEEADGVADAFGLLGHAEIFRADYLVIGQKINVPIGRGVGFQGRDHGFSRVGRSSWACRVLDQAAARA